MIEWRCFWRRFQMPSQPVHAGTKSRKTGWLSRGEDVIGVTEIIFLRMALKEQVARVQ